MKAAAPECWPGTDIRRSTDNGFSLGYGKTPHGFDTSKPAKPAKIPPRISPRTEGSFGTSNGYIDGLGKRGRL